MSTEEKEYVPTLDEMVFFEGDTIEHPFGGETVNEGKDPTTDSIDAPASSDVEEDINTSSTTEVEDSSDNEEDTSADVEDVTEEDASDDDIDPASTDTSESPLEAYYNFLVEQDLLYLPEEFKFDGTPESFQKAVQASQENVELKGAQALWNRLPEDFQLVLEYGLNGGTDINKVRQIIDNQFNLSDANLEDVKTQKDLVRAHLSKTTRYSDKKIDKVINRLISVGELEEEAESALTELKDLQAEERKQLAERAAEETQQRQEQLKKSYEDFSQVVADLNGVSKKQKDQIIRSIWTTGQYGNHENISYFNYVDSQVKSNPQHLAQLAEMYLSYDPKKGFKSDVVTRKAKTELNKNFRNSIDKLTKGKSKVKGGSSSKLKGNRSRKKDINALEMFLKQS